MAASPAHIRQLPEGLANQIAAGEVIERPAAVVKELAENSLDAGATRIVIVAEDGGRRLIQITDDGQGIHAGELSLALARHATSKLQVAEDLFRIATLGFRGEALPSIGAVSEFTLESRPHAQEQGQRLSQGLDGQWLSSPCAMAAGTQVTVRNLFWNVPARLKFLKSEAAENGHITEQVIRLALSHPAVGFRLEIAGKAVLDLPSGQILPARLRDIFGKAFTSGLLAVAHSNAGMQLSGFIAHPREAKLNGRWVRDKLLLAAVREGFKGFLEPRLHGAVVLHLDIDPKDVDVNVHPTKSEVRFRRDGEVFSLVCAAVAATLAEHSGDFSLLTPSDAAKATQAASSHSLLAEPGAIRLGGIVARTTLPPAAPPAYQERFIPHQPLVESPSSYALPPGAAGLAPVASPAAGAVPPSPPATAAAGASPAPAAPLRVGSGSVDFFTAASAGHLPPGVRRVLQLHRMFLLIETDEGLRLVDQHALHEKALFVAFDDTVGDLRGTGSQELLVPRSIELTAMEVAAVEALLPSLAAYGIQAEVFGPTTLLVRASPPRLKRLNWVSFFADLALSGSDRTAMAMVRERIQHSAACHGAVKAGMELSREEQLELVFALYHIEGMEHCPHGRPTTLDLSWAELGRRFQRS